MSKSPYAWGTVPQETRNELYGTWVDFCHLFNLGSEFTDFRGSAAYNPMRPIQDYACVVLFWLGFNVDDVDMLAAEDAAWRFPPGRFSELPQVSRLHTEQHYQTLYRRVNVRLKTLAQQTGALNDLRSYLKENPVEAVPVATQLRLIFKHSCEVGAFQRRRQRAAD